MLYDISGVTAGWAKINKGMLKMYNVEVLSKFPVVQHFPFGSLFRWEQDPAAATISTSIHTESQPQAITASRPPVPSTFNAQESTRVPWKTQSSTMPPANAPLSSQMPTRTPWASGRAQDISSISTTRPTFSPAGTPSSISAAVPAGRGPPATTAPWARASAPQPSTNLPSRKSKESQARHPG